jgi:preprotein translocase subunit SecD
MRRLLARWRSSTGVFTRVILLLTAASLASVLTACGGDEDQPSVRLQLEADLSGISSEVSTDLLIDALLDVLHTRAIMFGISDAILTRGDSGRIFVTLPGVISEEDARQLMLKTALLELRQPVLDEGGDIICQPTSGARFSVSREDITYTPETPDGGFAPRCLGGGGQSGEIVWEPVTTDGQDQVEDAPPLVLVPLSARVDRTRAPVVLIALLPDDAELLQTASERLLGLPLGIFLDGDLLAGPTIQEPLSTGNIAIGGLPLNEAIVLAAQLSAGSLPVPVNEISIESTSE